MKHMHNIYAFMIMLATMQAYGWEIDFLPDTWKHTFELLTFDEESDYHGMQAQMGAGSGFSSLVGVMAPLAGKLGGDTVGKLKVETDGEEVLKYSATEIALIQASISAASSIAHDASKSGMITNFINRWTKEGYSIDFIQGFKPTKDDHIICRDEKSLAKHVIHPVKTNKQIFFVILDKDSQKLVYAGLGHAYGSFTFSLKKITADDTGAEITVGDLDEIDWEGGRYCTAGKTVPAV